jgi:transformer-2 protein
METGEEADAAITALNATEIMGKITTVEKARRGRARTPTPGRYYGPPKRHDYERPYDPRPYDTRYSRDYDQRGGGRGGWRGHEDRPRDYDRGGYRDFDRGYGGGRDYDRGGRYDDRKY